MALPQAIQKQVDAAAVIEQQLSGQPPEEPGTPPTAAPAEPPQPVVTQTAPQAGEDWEQKYRTLQGMFNAQVQTLTERNRTLEAQVTSMATRLMETAAPAPQPSVAPPDPALSDADIETFGADMVDMAARAARSEVAKAQQKFDAEMAKRDEYIRQLEAKVGVVSDKQVVSDKDRFYLALNGLVPNWAEVNKTQGFLEWLGAVDPVYGVTRQAALDHAANQLDVHRTAAIFNSYLRLTNPEPAPSVARELKSQVTPARSGGTSAPAQPAMKRQWTQKQITEFYSQWRRKEIPEDQALQMEADIDAAAAEGRIV